MQLIVHQHRVESIRSELPVIRQLVVFIELVIMAGSLDGHDVILNRKDTDGYKVGRHMHSGLLIEAHYDCFIGLLAVYL